VTATHTAGVYLLGLLTIGAAQFIVPERLYPILGVLSGATIILIGLMLTRSRLLQLLGRNQAAAGDHDHGHTHHQINEAVLTHTHGGSTHTHTLTEVQDGISMRSLLALGVSGGLLPCPSALVVLLVAISLGNALLGMVLVAAFSLGLAGVLTGIGLLLVYGGAVASRTSLFQRVARTGVAKLVPVASAVAVTIAGGVITVQSL
jgi:ABC-type nickel/cobalt efflux system permease component RcnA